MRVQGQTVLTHPLHQRRRQRRAQVQGELLGRNRRMLHSALEEPRRLLQPRQGGPPSRNRLRAVLPGKPRQIIAVGRHAGEGAVSGLVGVEREQLPHQDR